MSGYLDDMATSWEVPSDWLTAIPADRRDFHRPREPFMESALGLDTNMADDSNSFIKTIQQFMKSSPLGVSYIGEIDGENSPLLENAIETLQSRISSKFPNTNISLMSGHSPSQSGFAQLMELLNPKQTNNQESISQPIQSAQHSQIADFQKLFGLEPTGIMDEHLAQAAKDAESKISNSINDSNVHGMIFDPNTKSFKTTPGDVSEALKLINLKDLSKKSSTYQNLYNIFKQ